MTSVAQRLGQFVAEYASAEVPELALTHAKMVIASTLASAAVGVHIDSAAAIRGLALERGGRPEAHIWFTPPTAPALPVELAARVNAVASDAAASDDSDLRNIAHIGTIVSATALATGERIHAPGLDVLAAIVLGYEVAGRIGAAITPGYSDRGFHGSVITVFGGATVAARLLKLPPEGVARAIALAATSIGGLYAAANTSVAREYHAGLSAMLGLEAALAAARGFAVDERIMEAPRGFFETFGANPTDPVTAALGWEWEILSHLAIKLVPGAHPYHAAAEATADAARQLDVAPDEIQSIVVAARSMGRNLYYHPTDLVGMAHSLPYFLAAAAVDRTFGWEHASPSKILDPVIDNVQNRVVLDPDAQNSLSVAGSCGARVSITSTTGRMVTSTILAPRGSCERGIEWADVDEKYRRLMALSGHESASVERSLSRIHELEGVQDISDLQVLIR